SAGPAAKNSCPKDWRRRPAARRRRAPICRVRRQRGLWPCLGPSLLKRDALLFEASSRFSLFLEHDVFPETRTHFSASCSRDGAARGREGQVPRPTRRKIVRCLWRGGNAEAEPV